MSAHAAPASPEAVLAQLHAIADGVVVLDAEWRVVFANAEAERVLGLLAGPGVDGSGLTLWQRFPALRPSPLGKALRGAARDGAPSSREDRAGTSWCWIESRIHPTPEGVTLFLVEVTDRRGRIGALLDSVDDVVFTLDRDQRCRMIFGRWLEREGFRPEMFLGRVSSDIGPRADASRHEEANRRALAGETVAYEWTFRSARGERTMQTSLAPLRSPDGAVTGIVGVGRDITDRVAAEREIQRLNTDLRRQVAELRTLVDLIPLGIGIARDRECSEVAVNPGLAAALRIPPGENATSWVAAPGLPMERAARLGVAVNGVEEDIVHADGTIMTLLCSAVPLFDEAGAPRGAVGVFLDITERKRAAERQRLLADILEHAAWGVATADVEQGVILSLNPAFARMHDVPPEDLIGRSLGDLVAPEHAGAFADYLARASEDERQVFEIVHRRRDGHHFPVLVDLTAVRDEQGRPAYYAVNVQDLTERRRAEERQRQAQKMEAVGRLAAGIAHDFNNVVMIILGFSDFLLTGMDRDDSRRIDLQQIRKAATRAASLTRQLLAFGRQAHAQREVIDLNAVVAELERMLSPILPEDIRLGTRLPPDIGGIDADRSQIEQVVMNLALNARDAMPGGGRLVIETAAREFAPGEAMRRLGIDLPAGVYVMLMVSDTGHGMSDEVRARLFEPYFTTKTPTHNSGLGLTTVYGIVAQSGGYIWVDSEPGEGSTFTVCFPRSRHPVSPSPASPGSADHPAELGGSETVLVVEDEQAVRSLASRVLLDHGYRVLAASNGIEALAVVEQSPDAVDLVLSDVVMPEMGGAELAERLRTSHPGMRVLLMSGYPEQDGARSTVDQPGASLLQKPFTPRELARRVRALLDRRAAS